MASSTQSPDFSATLIAASNLDVTTYTRIPAGPGKRGGFGAAQLARVCVSCNGALSTNTQVVRFALCDSTTVYCVQDASVTAPATVTRSAIAGAAGNYVGVVKFDGNNGSQNDKIDLAGIKGEFARQGLEWRVGLAAAFQSGITSVQVDGYFIYDV